MTDRDIDRTFRAAIQKGVKPSQDVRSHASVSQDIRIARGVHGGLDAMRSASVIRRF